ncbi:hypothetical protein BCR33DRAFT_246834 [Rhizoclosmatium globosum]|uniref:Basal body-orientation factor 1 n=1 Tax=Rhizoclosmatium globosum TaxID=329046 RepID=A0A1Y2C9K1_9FUNG|nr:hypothetical protein BCR33DRAFT_246834 [Rhizoclosmatium globosum]|eukprot:ORY43712.1 hypothetical protein BCR33DRAFT_246834 [Rhizoclosmatium globosum]
MNAILNEKDAAFKVMQAEFAVIKDFRKKRQDMLKDLEYQKEELADTERQHKETITRMERKFFEEKIRLQKEANRKISELASKAHKEAVSNLNETTKDIYKENIRMAESLRYHVEEGAELQKQNRALLQANRQLMEEKDLHNVIVKEKVLQVKQQAQEIKELNIKIESMEHSLSHVVREFEHEREIIGKLARKELNEVRKVASRLRENLEVKTYEMKHIKRLAQHVLDQRTKMEKFFLDALDHVRSQLQKEREMAKKAAHTDYNKKIREVMSKRVGPFPPVQSFRQSATPLTNQFNINAATAVATSIMKPPPSPPTQTAIAAEDATDSASATKPAKPAGQVDIQDLSWADKERVLRLLFAKMNGVALGVEGDDDQVQEEPEPMYHDPQDDVYDDSMYHDGGAKYVALAHMNVVDVGRQETPKGSVNQLAQQEGAQHQSLPGSQQLDNQVGGQNQQQAQSEILNVTVLPDPPQPLPPIPLASEQSPSDTQPQPEQQQQQQETQQLPSTVQANDLVVTEIGDDQSNRGETPNTEGGEQSYLTTAYSGSRRNLIPKSENQLPPILSGVTPQTDLSRAESVSSNH